MEMLILSGTPKADGLCRSVINAAAEGARAGGAEVRVEEMAGIARCHVCGDGWGTCRTQRRCAFGDDGFDRLHEAARRADALCLATPVYWGGMAEGLKSFTDRLRRCECDLGSPGALAGKPVLLIASAGGSGGGLVECLEPMVRFCRHVDATVFDCIGVNRWNSDYKRAAARAAALALAAGRRPNDTVDTWAGAD